jgi:hypothetical protein
MRKTQHDYLNINHFTSKEIRESITQFPNICVNQPTRNGQCNLLKQSNL